MDSNKNKIIGSLDPNSKGNLSLAPRKKLDLMTKIININ